MSVLAGMRVSTKCPRCEMPLIVPEWSEFESTRGTIHIWQCPMCGNEFETADAAGVTMSDGESFGDLFTSVLVA